MRKFLRFIGLASAALLFFGVCACGKSGTEGDEENTNEEETVEQLPEITTEFTVTEETEVASTDDYTQTTLYFSWEGGKRIFGAEILPANYREGEKLPTIILSHGYGGRYSDELDRAYRFAKYGYACFTFDFGGINPHSQTDGVMTDMTLDTEKEELQAVIDFVSTRSYCNRRNLTLYGESMGGLVTTLAAAEAPGRFATLVLIYPALSIPTDYHNGGGLANWKKFKDNALSYYGRVDEICERCTMPVLIQHGTADELVNISYSRHAAEVFPNATLIELEGAGHAVNMPWKQVIKDADEFIYDNT